MALPQWCGQHDVMVISISRRTAKLYIASQARALRIHAVLFNEEKQNARTMRKKNLMFTRRVTKHRRAAAQACAQTCMIKASACVRDSELPVIHRRVLLSSGF